MTHRLALLSLILLLTCPLPAAAMQVLELTGGTIRFPADSSQFGTFLGKLDGAGPRVSITAVFQTILGNSGSIPGFKWCDVGFFGGVPCGPGAHLEVGGMWADSDFHSDFGGGQATLDGITHAVNASTSGFDDGLALRLTGTVRIPDFGDIVSVTLAAPFQLDGLLFRRSEPPFPGGMFPDTTVYGLHGQGEFLLALHRTKIGGFDAWQWDSMVFELQPTPEPATLLLWGTGTAGLGLARWFRRRSHGRPSMPRNPTVGGEHHTGHARTTEKGGSVMIHRLALLSLASLLLACPLPASAIQALELNAGSITSVYDSGASTFDLHGPRLRINDVAQTIFGNAALLFRYCGASPGSTGCNPGDLIQDQDRTIGGGDWFGGTVTLDGIPQPHIPTGFGDSVVLQINSSPLLIPDFGSIAAVTLLGTFRLEGTLARRLPEVHPPHTPDDTDFAFYELYGQGTVTLDLVRKRQFGTDVWQWTASEYELQPTPEPATLLLWGTGAAGLGVVRWIRRRPWPGRPRADAATPSGAG